jgi:predicted nucleic acid-binding protein
VIDAGVGIARVLDLAYSAETHAAWERWEQASVDLYAPSLWQYETANTVRKSLSLNLITSDQAVEALETILDLDVAIVSADAELARSASRWASRLKQRAIYDSFYLALAERWGKDFWSTDKRLVNGARQIGATWVHWIGEAVPTESDSQIEQ